MTMMTGRRGDSNEERGLPMKTFLISSVLTALTFFGMAMWSIAYTFPLSGHTPVSPEREKYHALAIAIEDVVLLPTSLMGLRYLLPVAVIIWGVIGGLMVLGVRRVARRSGDQSRRS